MVTVEAWSFGICQLTMVKEVFKHPPCFAVTLRRTGGLELVSSHCSNRGKHWHPNIFAQGCCNLCTAAPQHTAPLRVGSCQDCFINTETARAADPNLQQQPLPHICVYVFSFVWCVFILVHEGQFSGSGWQHGMTKPLAASGSLPHHG